MTSAYELENGDGPYGPGLKRVPEHFKRVAGDPLAGWTCMSPAPIPEPERNDSAPGMVSVDGFCYGSVDDPEAWAAAMRALAAEPPGPIWEDDLTWRAKLERWRQEIRKRWRR